MVRVIRDPTTPSARFLDHDEITDRGHSHEFLVRVDYGPSITDEGIIQDRPSTPVTPVRAAHQPTSPRDIQSGDEVAEDELAEISFQTENAGSTPFTPGIRFNPYLTPDHTSSDKSTKSVVESNPLSSYPNVANATNILSRRVDALEENLAAAIADWKTKLNQNQRDLGAGTGRKHQGHEESTTGEGLNIDDSNGPASENDTDTLEGRIRDLEEGLEDIRQLDEDTDPLEERVRNLEDALEDVRQPENNYNALEGRVDDLEDALVDLRQSEEETDGLEERIRVLESVLRNVCSRLETIVSENSESQCKCTEGRTEREVKRDGEQDSPLASPPMQASHPTSPSKFTQEGKSTDLLPRYLLTWLQSSATRRTARTTT